MSDLTEIFGPAISTYTREQAIADGVLVDVSATARGAGVNVPTVLTASVWADCVAWDEADNERKGTLQDEAGRLWDVLWMASMAMRRTTGQDRVSFPVLRVVRAGRGCHPHRTTLVVHLGPGDLGEPVVTIMRPDED